MNTATIIQKFIDKVITKEECSQELHCSIRTVERKVAKYKSLGPPGIKHGLCGRSSNNKSGYKLDPMKHQASLKKYHEFGPTLLAEVLGDVFGGVEINPETMRLAMIRWGLWVRKESKRKVKKQLRERKEMFGMMQQNDGSYHIRIEGMGEVCLLCAIDDATSSVTSLKFTSGESLKELLHFRYDYFKKHGKPGMIYVDRHATYKVNHPQDQFDEPARTRFYKGMAKLGIVVIFAKEPEGKGRVERGFGTHQDRLVKLMRLEGIKTVEDANRYLNDTYISHHNSKFAIKPKKPGNYHKPFTVDDEKNFKWYFAEISERIVKKDGTIAYKNKIYQISKGTILINNKKIHVYETMDGEIKLMSKDKEVHFEKR